MKKTLLVLTILYLLLLCSCSKVDNNFKVSDNEQGNETTSEITELSDGCVNKYGYYNYSGNLVYFFDSKTEQRIVLCNKPNCQHNSSECNAYISSKVVNTDDVPSAVMNSTAVFIFSRNDRINLLLTDGTMLSMNYDGTNHKNIAVIDSKYTYDKAYMIENQIYINANFSTQENGEVVEKSCFIIYNTETNEWKQGKEFDRNLTGDNLIGITRDNFAIYYSHDEPSDIPLGTSLDNAKEIAGKTKCNLYKIDMNNAQKSVIYEGTQGNCYPATMLNGTVYYYSQNDENLCSMDPKTEESNIVYKNISGEVLFDTPIDGHLVLARTKNITEQWNPEDEVVEFFDVNSNELVEAYSLESNLDWNNNFRGILGETLDSYIMIYKADFTVDNSESDIPSVSDMKPYIGIIKKNDFWNGNYNFKEISWLI